MYMSQDLYKELWENSVFHNILGPTTIDNITDVYLNQEIEYLENYTKEFDSPRDKYKHQLYYQ